MTEENRPIVEVLAEFATCPWCGSTRRMMEELGKKLAEQGLIRSGLPVGLIEVGGPIVDPTMTSQMLFVSTRPGRFALQDICMGCGRQITTRIEEKPVTVGMGPPPSAGGALHP